MGLITTKDKLKEFLAISSHTNIESVAPYIERAEREFVIPQIGQAMYDDAVDFFESNGTPTTDAVLLKKLQEAIANFSFYLYFDMLAVNVSDSGVQRIESTNQKTAYQYQEVNLRNNLLTTGYETLGNTLEYLEKYKTTYTPWASDTMAYNRFKFLIIHNPTLFQEYFDVKNSWATFFALRPSIKMVEDLCLEPVLGTTFLLELKNEIKANTATNAVLIELMRKAVVFMVVAYAAKSKIVQFGKDGAFEVRKAGLSIKKEDPAESVKISAFINQNETTGELYLKRLTTHLNKEASATKYTTYFNSEQYVDPTASTSTQQIWKNSSDNKSVIV